MGRKRTAAMEGTRPRGSSSRKSIAVSAPGSKNRETNPYREFAIYSGKKSPSWHPIKKMRYVFWRMIAGLTVADALREIHWHESDFWHLVDLKRKAPFREEYKRAKILQSRAFSDSVVAVAEGRDAITRAHTKRIRVLIRRAMKRTRGMKNRSILRVIVANMMRDVSKHDAQILGRNRLQMEAAKWIAKMANPAEFGDRASLALGAPDGEGDNVLKPIQVQFVGPDGKVVAL